MRKKERIASSARRIVFYENGKTPHEFFETRRLCGHDARAARKFCVFERFLAGFGATTGHDKKKRRTKNRIFCGRRKSVLSDHEKHQGLVIAMLPEISSITSAPGSSRTPVRPPSPRVEARGSTSPCREYAEKYAGMSIPPSLEICRSKLKTDPFRV